MSHVDPGQQAVAETLIGRDKELELIRAFIAKSAASGDVLLLFGEPGVGKTVLLDVAAHLAAATGTRVLRAAGAQFEADVSFAGLNQVLLPLRGECERLSAIHRDALSVALGFGEGPAPDRLVVSTAALDLLRQAAGDRQLLVIVDDLLWFDRSSAAVLGFVARRLAGSRIGFLAASQSGTETFFELAGLPVHYVQPLADEASARLLDGHFPMLAPGVRRRVLVEAKGNPLALLELPAAMSDPQRLAAQALPTVLPLNRRLQSLFASRMTALPAPTLRALLLTALEGDGDLRVLSAAPTGPQGLEDLAPAERARLVRVDENAHRLGFRHPLIRAAVVERSTSSERRAAHRALAQALADQPERRAWHLAEATVGSDEQVAGLLEQAARRILRRGDAVGAVAALLRSADLSPRGTDRARRLAEAAYVGAHVTGELRNASALLVDARRADPEHGGALQAAIATAYLLLTGDGDVETAHHLLVGAIEMYPGRNDAADHALIEALHILLMVCFFSGGRADLWASFHAAVDRLRPRVPAVLSLCATTFADPARCTPAVLDELAAAIQGLRYEVNPAQIVRIGMAANFVDRVSGCREALWRVVHDGRQGGAVASAISALLLLSFDDVQEGRWEEADQLADEALALCEGHGYYLPARPFLLVKALLAARRGDDDTTRTWTDRMTQWAAPRGARSVIWFAHHALGLAALARGDFEEAYQQTAAISPPGILVRYVPLALWVMLDLVEAAVRTERRAEANAHVNAMREADIAAVSPRLALLANGSAAIAAPDDSATELFEDALAVPGIDRWPFDVARVRLAYGEHLRRTRAISEAREELTVALKSFESLGAGPWAKRAQNELQATSRTKIRSSDSGTMSLTPQELKIATLAATGLSNKQIGERLHLSHRTVGAHLYRVFPKLGVTSRAALRDALPPPNPR